MLPRALGRRWVGFAVIVLAVGLASTSVGDGFQWDDYMVVDNLEDGLGAAFRFIDHPTAADRVSGFMPWWAADDLRISFFRPLAAASHALDQALAPGSAELAHVHSLAWFGAMLLAALALLRRLMPSAWLAHLALIVYALDDARGPTVSWLSNRNALMVGALSFLSLWAHDRARRDGWRPGRWLALAAFALALLCGEVAVSAGALFLAHALTFEPGPRLRRLVAIWPYAALGVLWLAAHHAGGYGTHGAEGYLDPFDAPLGYLGRMLMTTPVVLGGALGIWTDFFPGMGAEGRAVYLAIDVGVILFWALFFRSFWQRFAVVRFGLLASVLAALPLAGGLIADRYLTFVSLGVAIAAAMFLGQVADATLRHPRQTALVFKRLILPTAIITTLLWIVGGVLGLPARARSMALLGRIQDETLSVVRRDPSEPLYGVNLPNEGLFDYVVPVCHGRGIACPPARALLATRDAVTVERVDARTLRFDVPDGLFATQADRMTTTSTRLAVGHRVDLGDVVMTVEALGADLRPTRVRAEFATPVEEGRRFVAYGDVGPIDWTPPPVGARVTVGPIDALKLMLHYLEAK